MLVKSRMGAVRCFIAKWVRLRQARLVVEWLFSAEWCLEK
jgi:hypothetical protein